MEIKKKKSNKLIIIAGIIVFVIVIVAAGVFVYGNMPQQRVQKQLSLGERYLEDMDRQFILVNEIKQ